MKAGEESRQRVAFWGRVTSRQTDQPLAGVQVSIIGKPAAFADWLALKAAQYGTKWPKMTRRPDRTYTAADGSFYFMDLPLPDGSYTLSAWLPGAGCRYGKIEKKVKITRDAEGKIKATPTNIELAPTSITGRILSKETGEPVGMAKVEALGSGEHVFSDQAGGFLLAGIEPVKSGAHKGKRQIRVTAPGYREVTRETEKLIDAGSLEDLKDIALN